MVPVGLGRGDRELRLLTRGWHPQEVNEGVQALSNSEEEKKGVAAALLAPLVPDVVKEEEERWRRKVICKEEIEPPPEEEAKGEETTTAAAPEEPEPSRDPLEDTLQEELCSVVQSGESAEEEEEQDTLELEMVLERKKVRGRFFTERGCVLLSVTAATLQGRLRPLKCHSPSCLGRRSCEPWRKVMAVCRAPARSPTGASRPRRMRPAGWPLSEGNGNSLLEPPAPNQPVEAPAKRAGRARMREKQVREGSRGREERVLEPRAAPAGAGLGSEVRVRGRGQAPRVAVIAVTRSSVCRAQGSVATR